MNRAYDRGSKRDVFYYDGKNRQIARVIDNQVQFSVWDDWELIEEYASPSVRSAAYLQGAHGVIRSLVGTSYYYYYQDSLGSTTHIANAAGQLLESFRYDLYGTPATPSAYGLTDLYAGERWIPELGLYDLRNRFMSPELGRFLQADPIGFKGDGSNLYRYCHNDPADFSDPTGLIDAQWSKEMWLRGNSPYSFNKLMEMHTDQPAGNISMGLVSKDEGAKGGKPKNGGLMPLPPELLGRMYETHQQNVEKANDKGNWTPIPGTNKSIQEEYATGIYRKGNGLVQDGPNKGYHQNGPKSEPFRKEYRGGGTRAAGTHVHVTGNGMHQGLDQGQAEKYHCISGVGSASAPGRLDIFRPYQSGGGGEYFHTDDGVRLYPGH